MSLEAKRTRFRVSSCHLAGCPGPCGPFKGCPVSEARRIITGLPSVISPYCPFRIRSYGFIQQAQYIFLVLSGSILACYRLNMTKLSLATVCELRVKVKTKHNMWDATLITMLWKYCDYIEA